jgi:hypothetical protein
MGAVVSVKPSFCLSFIMSVVYLSLFVTFIVSSLISSSSLLLPLSPISHTYLILKPLLHLGRAMAQLAEALHHKTRSRGFDSLQLITC